ncbi:uncharacterized protein [Apostichopus japonicus]|uniref:uncharacterized protein isoform X4 n=1 Tax=Stichopus japonicus TaxID=307972 RepID=UPI003AB4D0D6
MFNFRLAAVVILLQYSPCIYAGGSCQENIYLEVGKQGVVSCDFENFDIIGWINGDGNVRDTSPFIYIEGSKIYGRGYRSGDYDMHPNGSLIINEVKLKNEFNYTVLLVPPGGGNEYFKVPVKVYVPPDPGYPVVNGRTNQVVIHGKTRGFINCSMTGIRPRVDLEWVASPDEISLNSSHRVTDNSDGTYNTYLNSSYKVVNSPTGRVSSKCRVAGDLAAFIPLETTVYLLLEQRFPVLNGLANQQHVVLDVNREGELTCSMDKVLQDVSLELVTIFPDSSDEILLDNKYNITVNGDDTVNITLTSRFQVLSDSTQHFTLKCRVSGQAADKYPEATTVELLVTESFPVVNGLANQQHVVLHVNREGELTFSMDKVSQDVSLELVTIFPDSSDEILLDNRNNSTANEDGTVNITLTSKFRVLKRSIRHFTLQCRVTGQAADKYPEATTVELLVTESFPVINGLANQQHVVLDVNREGELTCSMDKVSQDVSLELVNIIPDSSDEILLDSKNKITANGDDTVNITLTSKFRVLSASIQHFTLQCRVSGQAADKYPEATTVELFVLESFPVVNGLANQQHVVLDVNREDELTCSMDKVSQDVSLELVTTFPDSSDEILLDNKNHITVNEDDTVNITLTSSIRVLSDSTQHFILKCRVSGQAEDKYPKATTVELLVTESFPVVNGLANQQHVVLDVNREGELTCSMDKVSQDVSLELVTIFPDSSDEILLDNENKITVNGNDTVNITLTSSFRVLSDSTQHFILQCRVSGQAADKYPEATTVELLVTETTSMLPVPVIDGCYSQSEACTLMMTTEGTITCSVKGVPHHYDLNLDLYTLPDLRCLSLITDRIDTHRSGYYDIITSCRYIVDETFIDTMVHCFLSGTDRNIQPVNSTVKAKVMWQAESMLPVPVIDGCYSQPEACTLRMTTEETITCSVKGVPHNYDLNLDLYTLPDLLCLSPITVRIDTHPGYDIITSCRYNVDEPIMETTVHCFLSGTDRNIQPVNSTVKAKIMWQATSMLPVPVIDGCYGQPEACTLMMTTEETITCSVKGVPLYYELNLDLYTLPDLLCLSPITNRIDTHRSGYYDIITSCRYIVDETFIDTMVHCFLSGTDRNIQPVNSTVKAKVIWQDQDSEGCRKCEETDQDWEDRIGWPQTVNTVILVFLTIEMNLILLMCLKHKDYVRKFYRSCVNSTQRKDLEEAGAADNQNVQEMQPLKEQESLTDSGLSYSPNSSTASGDLTEQVANTAQNFEADVC